MFDEIMKMKESFTSLEFEGQASSSDSIKQNHFLLLNYRRRKTTGKYQSIPTHFKTALNHRGFSFARQSFDAFVWFRMKTPLDFYRKQT